MDHLKGGVDSFSYFSFIFSYLMVAGAIDWNICPEVLGMNIGSMVSGPFARFKLSAVWNPKQNTSGPGARVT
jgi:hypothetical protein